MDKHLAERLMQQSLAVGAQLNLLSALADAIADERERYLVRLKVGEAMAQMAVLELELVRQFPELDPDRSALP